MVKEEEMERGREAGVHGERGRDGERERERERESERGREGQAEGGLLLI